MPEAFKGCNGGVGCGEREQERMEDFQRQMNLVLRMSADSEEEAWAVSDVWVQALMVRDYATIRRLMEAGAVQVAAADQSYPQPVPPEEAARARRNLGAFLAAGEALRQAQDSPDTAPDDLRHAREDFDQAKADFDPPFTNQEI